MTLLANSQSGESVVWLEAMGVPFLSLYEQDLSGNPVGAILILNAEEQHSNWPDVIEPLRMSLPEFGWSSLSTQLPTPAAATIPERSLPPLGAAPNAAEESSSEDDVDGGEATAKAEEQTLSLNKTETEDPPAAAMPKENNTGSEKREDQPEDTQLPVEEVALQRLQASINFLHSKGQFNIVLLGNGIGATRAACFISSEVNSDTAPQNRLVRALVLVNARNQIRGSDMQLHHCLTTPKTPVLDVYTGLSQRDRLEAKQRLKSSNRNNYRVYQQIHLPEVAHNSMLGENRLTRRIRGFLESHARGVKVDNAVIVDR